MEDLLLKQRQFRISTPMAANRDIFFTEDFKDFEFDRWKVESDTVSGKKYLSLYKDNQRLCKLSYDKDSLAGFDARGGQTVIKPLSSNTSKFTEYFNRRRKVAALQPAQNVVNTAKYEKKHDSAVVAISGSDHLEGWDCDVYQIKSNLFETVDQLFSAGYKNVIVANCSTTPHFIPLAINLASYLIDKVGAVQLVSDDTGEGDELISETGPWKGFLINDITWGKIRGWMKDTKYNFYRNIDQAFKHKNLIRLSTAMSRDRRWTKSDSRRKNFKVLGS
jgi:hypothetical protein